MTAPTGTTWTVDHVISVTDGDTLRLIRSRPIELDGRQYTLTDREPKGIPIRLVWVDTPEKGNHPGWENARADLASWVSHHTPLGAGPGTGFRVVCYESGGWDRLMGDLLDADGNSASQWLMAERGWPPYVAGR